MASNNFHRYPVTQKYLMARKSSIMTPASRFEKFIKGDEVYGIILDMPVAENVIATLVAYINGAANIHYNNGLEYVGAAKKYLDVVKAANLYVQYANEIFDRAERVAYFDLPKSHEYTAYFLTAKGIYRYAYVPSELAKDDEKGRIFHFGCRNLMRELHEAQLKDRNAAEKKES